MTTTPAGTPSGTAPGTPPGPPPGPPPDAPSDEGPRITREEVRDLGRLRRSVADRKVAGVAGGLARHLDIDPVLLRVAFVVLAFFGGAGLLLYAAAWALVPEEGGRRAAVDLDERSRTVALVVVAVVAALALAGDSWGAFWFPWPVIVVALVALVVWVNVTDRGPAVGARPAPPEVDPETGEPLPPAAWVGDPADWRSPPGPAPRDPRRRGPVLFWFTLALVAFTLGVLGILDGAGVPVVDSAYPALAVGVIGAMLLVGSVVGRGGGLILLGLLASLVLTAGTAAEHWDGDRVVSRPTTAADVQDVYRLGTGELVVDLRGVSDLGALDGRAIEIVGDAGRLEVLLPDGVDAEVVAEVSGPGGFELFGRDGGGIDWRQTATHDGGTDVPSLQIDASIGVGEIVVTTERGTR